MALPTQSIPWPPPKVGAEIKRVQGYAAWYGGDKSVIFPQSVASVTSGRWPFGSRWTSGGNVASGRGESNPIHVPLAADIARTSADLLFSDCPDISVGDNATAAARWEEIEDGIGLEAMLVEAGELGAALSGIYWRVTFDPADEPRWPIPTFIQPDNAWPEWSWGRMTAVTFWRVLPSPPGLSEKLIYRHLERHSVTAAAGVPVARVEHGLYLGEEDKLGRPMALTDHPDLEGIVKSLTHPGEGAIVMPGVTRTAGYVPNMLPNRLDRGSRLGRPDIEQQEDLLRGVDDTWTSWMRDLRLGRARLVVPSEYLRIGAPGEGAAFDVDREIYEPLRGMMAPSNSDPSAGIKAVQFAIRVAEHEATLRAQVQQIVTSAGYNLFSFGMDGGGQAAATATEVDARTDLSLVSKGKKARYWTAGLRDLVSAIMTMDYALRFPGAVQIDPAAVRAEIERDIAPRPQETAQTANLLAQAKAASTQTLVQLVHPEWTPAEVMGEVQRIREEQGVPAPDPTALGGAAGGSPVDALLAQMGMNGQGQPGANGQGPMNGQQMMAGAGD